jgi:predicted ATPase
LGGGDNSIFEFRVHESKNPSDASFSGWRIISPVWQKEVEDALQDQAFAELIAKELRNIGFHGAKGIFEASENPSETPAGIAESEAKKKLQTMLVAAKLQLKKRIRLREQSRDMDLFDFIIYAPENTTLRNPPPESAIQPLGPKGEGLFRLLQSFTDPKFSDRLADMKERLRLFDWFEDFLAPDESAAAQARLQIRDRWLAPEKAVFDQRSANEGFLFALFYFTLLMSWRTPRFFALDNVDTALNPKLCSALMKQIVELAIKYDKQVICTTHNPAMLDGLNINDDAQRLYTVLRDEDGRTIVNRVQPPKPANGKAPMKLSAAFLAGNIGGLPENF